jgi:AraC-like DNA-binding protein
LLDFDANELETLTDSKRPFRRSTLPPLPRIDALRRLIEERLASGAPPIAVEELAFALADRVLGEAGRAVQPTDGGRSARERVLRAIQVIERSQAEPLGLAQVAEASGLSPFHFLRLFKRETGDTPYRFLVRARLRRAIDLLRDTDRPVTQVAFEVGFGDLSNFINTFRREVGQSPLRFRKAG